jgi:hypothetical protein
MMVRWMAASVVLATACGDRVVADADESSTGMPAGSTTDEDGSDDDASDVGDTSGPSTSIGESSTTAPVEMTCDDGDPVACPPGCTPATSWRIEDDACTATPTEVCVAIGNDAPAGPTTFWSDSPDGPRFVEAGSDCGIDPAPGDGWTECSGSADEPAECACFCAGGVCSGDADHDLLESCGFDEPCPELVYNELKGVADETATTCMLEALRDRVAGVYRFRTFSGFGSGYSRVYVDGDVAYRMFGASGEGTECPTAGEWQPTEACELASSDYFADCFELVGTPDDCAATYHLWTTDCVPQAPTCPG